MSKEDVYTLKSGDAVLQWPNTITAEEYEELEDWLGLMLKKMKRSITRDGVLNPDFSRPSNPVPNAQNQNSNADTSEDNSQGTNEYG